MNENDAWPADPAPLWQDPLLGDRWRPSASPWPPPAAADRFEPASAPLAGPPEEPPKRRPFAPIVVLVMLLALLLGAGAGLGLRKVTSDGGTASPSTTLPASPATSAPATSPSPTTESPAPTTPGTTAPQATIPTPTAPAAPVDPEALDVGVVVIDTVLGYEGGVAAGTGMVLTADGLVLTNRHVVEGATEIEVTIVTTGRTFAADVMGTDSEHDVALLRLRGAESLATVQLGDSTATDVGDAVTAVGNGGGQGGEPGHVSGTVTALDQDIAVSDARGGDLSQLEGLIQTNAQLQPGDSGGPLFDASGRVIGMNTAAERGSGRFRGGEPESYAIAMADALGVVEAINAGRASDTVRIGWPAFLGIQVDGSDAAQQSAGVEIAEVLDGTPADDAGLEAGDVIVGLDGQQISSDENLLDGLRALAPGDTVAVAWTDAGGGQHSASVTLATGPVA